MRLGRAFRCCFLTLGLSSSIPLAQAEDFLLVVEDHSLHWMAAENPEVSVKLRGSIPSPSFLRRTGSELWWKQGFSQSQSDLFGKNVTHRRDLNPDVDPDNHVDVKGIYHVVPNGDTTYWNVFGEAIGKTESSGEHTFLARGVNLAGLEFHGDRLYFGNYDTNRLESVRVDGEDHRVEIEDGLAARLTRHGDRLVWLSNHGGERSIKQARIDDGLDQRLVEVVTLADSFDYWVGSIAVTSAAVYWTGGDTLWKRLHGDHEPEAILTGRWTYPDSVVAIEGTRHPVQIEADGRIVTKGDPNKLYQLLYSDDLETWRPQVLQGSPLNEDLEPTLIVPKAPTPDGELSWSLELESRAGFFSVLEYEVDQ